MVEPEPQSGEDHLIAHYFRPLATHPGARALIDDAATFTPPAGADLVLTTDALVGGALLLGLAMVKVETWQRRLMLALGVGVVLAGFHALVWPKCLSRLEGVSPDVAALWLDHVREARPVWANGWEIASLIIALPVSGLLGYGLLGWTWRRDRDRLRVLLSVAAPALAATLLLAWQTRTAPAAQMRAGTDGAQLRSGQAADRAGEGDRPGQQFVPDDVGAAPGRTAASGGRVHLRRPCAARDYGDTS